MIFQSPGDIVFSIGGFSIYYYGIIMAFACFVGVWTSYKVFRRFNKDKNFEEIWDFAAYLLIFGFLGARLYYCMLNPVYYFYNPLEILNFREGGLSIHGGIIAGIIALVLLSKKYKLPVLNTLDAFVCGTALAQSIGRWGNFFNSEAFGSPTNLPWKLYISPSHRPEQYISYEYFHPTFLYESILDLFGFGILTFILFKFGKKYSGVSFFAYLTVYSVIRFFVERIRIDSALDIGSLHVAEIMSVILFVIGIAGMIFCFCRGRQSPNNI